MGVFIFAAVAIGAVTVQIEAVVGQADAVARGDFTLTRFNRIITEFDHFAAIEANQVIVMMLLRQLENGFTAFKVVTSDDARIVELVKYAIDRGKANLFTHVNQTLIEVFRTDMMIDRFLQHFEDF